MSAEKATVNPPPSNKDDDAAMSDNRSDTTIGKFFKYDTGGGYTTTSTSTIHFSFNTNEATTSLADVSTSASSDGPVATEAIAGAKDTDLLSSVNGLYRILDLYSENGSGGLVDKIIIDQHHVAKFINTMLPGAYKSMTNIDFAALDNIALKPIGIYGSKSEIVEFMKELHVITQSTASLLLQPMDPSRHSQRRLRSGMYILLQPDHTHHASAKALISYYVVYWPEDKTWDDRESVEGKRRVAFMHYLTHLTDQVRCLLSSEHVSSLVLKKPGEGVEQATTGEESDADSDDEIDHLFREFEVAKGYGEEDVQLRDSFTLCHESLALSPPNASTTFEVLPSIFVAGELSQAFLTLKRYPERTETQSNSSTYNEVRLNALLRCASNIIFLSSLDMAAVNHLMVQGGLRNRPNIFDKHKAFIAKYRRIDEDGQRAIRLSSPDLHTTHQERTRLQWQIRTYLIKTVSDIYSTLRIDSYWNFSDYVKSLDPEQAARHEEDSRTFLNNEDIKNAVMDVMKEADLTRITNAGYGDHKERLLVIRHLIEKQGGLTDEQRNLFGSGILSDKVSRSRSSFGSLSFMKFAIGTPGFNYDSILGGDVTNSWKSVKKPKDPQFIASLEAIADEDPMYANIAMRLSEMALASIHEKMKELETRLVSRIGAMQRKAAEERTKEATKEKIRSERLIAFQEFTTSIRHDLCPEPLKSTLFIEDLKDITAKHSNYNQYAIRAYTAYRVESEMKADLWHLQLTEHDQQRLRDDATHIPQPRLPNQPTYSFTLPPYCNVRHVQLLGAKSNTCLLITCDRNVIRLWLISSLKRFSYSQPTKTLHAITSEFLVAVDEQRKCLAIVFFDDHRLSAHMYSFDSDFTCITGRGSPMELARWYPDGVPAFTAACFFSGTDDLCLVESTRRIRVFSCIAQSFRPATINLSTMPVHVQSSPDGSALVVVEPSEASVTSCRVFHQASWGHNGTGIVTSLPPPFSHATAFVVSSIGQRSRAIIMGLDSTSQSIHAVSLEMSRKEAEYQLRAKRGQQQSQRAIATEHNSLIDCFTQVWSRFPVVAAIQKEVLSSAQRQPFAVTFVSESPDLPFESYFKNMVRTFDKVVRKPTGQKLARIVVHSSDSKIPTPSLHGSSSSLFKGGEWLTELICLIPIHVAVARKNRFVPLKDGVFDSNLERDLLGADVSAIIDSISLGWYESILGSYMATKPVKVISSIGEHGVGKSYSLNHIVDSSFIGSAVRTTEGAWLSICPTVDLLVVALTFEGIPSSERTVEEDTLLVLFNTALSNLILFRNHSAPNCDIASMFTSFRLSTHHFDPVFNPNLFKGRLVIMIKDVVDNDQEGVVQEFLSKLGQIVSRDGGENFITLLHDSQVTVLPWTVIQSREFYRLFSKLGRTLFRQRSTHANAGEFLTTLKTLMAKLKAQDWGSVDQTIIKHRVALLQSRLQVALATGLGETEPAVESLKNLDTQEIVNNHGDGPAVFCLETSPERVSAVLSGHLRQWKDDAARHPVEDLVAHLDRMLAARTAHVTDWLSQNIARLPPDNTDIRALKRSFHENLITLRSGIQLCVAECSSCRLRCMLNKAHDQMAKHDCGTSHRCDQRCDYYSDHYEVDEHCGFTAGHHGRHICDPSVHLCGEPCHLSDKRGCQKHCTKPSNHLAIDGLHECSARTHQCGKPCDLKKVRVPSGGDYSCQAFCSLPYNDAHNRHSCDNRLDCPIKCTLCQRCCTLGDHFHGLDNKATVHLCSSEHPCKYECQEAGICEVNATPRSTEATYTDLHGTFQYTKYAQVEKRLPCAVTIPAGETEHVGRHLHGLNENLFHFCEARCEYCNRICTLPLGHPQPEHDTVHGPMENTAWTIEGEDDATIEIEGRTYGVRDGGAPPLCSSVCRNLGRHAHIAYCDAEKGAQCQVPETEHITSRMLPNPNRAKDWVSHKLFWARTGFRDPYTREEKEEYALCDHHCPDPEHEATATVAANPSYCTLPIFHPPQPQNWQPSGNDSYVSLDGHAFPCPNPDSLRQAYHFIFVLHRSGFITESDRTPLPDQPVTQAIEARHNNRFGAALSACYAFWVSRSASVSAGNRRDAHSIITFDHEAQVLLTNDFTSEPDQLLNPLLTGANWSGGTNFDNALVTAQGVLENNWSNNRTPVILFLSDGACEVSDNVLFDLCNRSATLGTPLSIQAVSFGENVESTALRRMVTIAEQVAQSAPPDPQRPRVPSRYTTDIGTIRLTETFLNIATSLQKPRAALIRF